jgi:glycosyltransferase involved in cell wall biosynthesis
MNPAISVIIPVHNVEAYLPRFISSLSTQTFKNFEAICINDASSDNSGVLLDAWATSDSRVKILNLPRHRGAGAARNMAISIASGETACFADPDDVLPLDSLKVRYEAYRKYGAVIRGRHERLDSKGYVVYAAPILQGFEGPLRPGDIHPLPVNHFLKAHWSWLFPMKLLQDNRIRNEEGTSTAEDIAFLARLFFHIEKCVCLVDVVYYWVERDNSLSKKDYCFTDYKDYFHTHTIFYNEAKKFDKLSLADDYLNELIFDYINHLGTQIEKGTISKNEAERILDLMKHQCEQTNIIDKYGKNLPPHFNGICWLYTAMQYTGENIETRLKRGKEAAHKRQQKHMHELLHLAGFARVVQINRFDLKNQQVNLSYQFANKRPDELCRIGGQPVVPCHAKDRLVEDEGSYKIFERLLWLPLPPDGVFSVSLNGASIPICLGETERQGGISVSEIRTFFVHAPLNDSGFPQEIRMTRKLAQSPPMRKQYAQAWMFIDRDTQADDNAEHLYRWVIKNRPDVNAFFVLRETSPDWPRLSAAGFRLIPFGSMEHGILFILAEKLLSSQVDAYINSYISPKYVSDMRRTQFIYLRHGTVKDDMSPWLNQNDIDLCITSTRQEYEATTAPGTRYRLTEKEVVLTGLARHDSLLELAAPQSMILVMPTWRPGFLGKWDGKGQTRKHNPHFLQSAYARTWQAFFNNTKLRDLLHKHNFQVVFYSHPCMQDYLDEYDFPDFVKRESNATSSLSTILKTVKILVTDFSSIAFDMAYQEKPVIYYHADDKASYLEGHNWKNGYFDYERDGFGPVGHTGEQVLDALDDALNARCIPSERYLVRMKNTFVYKDGRCCERIFDAVKGM